MNPAKHNLDFGIHNCRQGFQPIRPACCQAQNVEAQRQPSGWPLPRGWRRVSQPAGLPATFCYVGWVATGSGWIGSRAGTGKAVSSPRGVRDAGS